MSQVAFPNTVKEPLATNGESPETHRCTARVLVVAIPRAFGTPYEQVFDAMEADGADGLVISDNGEHLANRVLIVKLAARYRVPTICPYREFAVIGGQMAYGVDLADANRRVADMTDQILRGAKPGDIPFQQQTKFELLLNRTAAAHSGFNSRRRCWPLPTR